MNKAEALRVAIDTYASADKIEIEEEAVVLVVHDVSAEHPTVQSEHAPVMGYWVQAWIWIPQP